MNLGFADFLTGDLDSADRILADAVEMGPRLGALPSSTSALAVRALIAIRRDDWPAAEALVEQATAVITTAHLQSYPPIALNHVIGARTAMARHDRQGARAELAAAGRLLPTLTHAFAGLAVLTRLELARTALGLGDLPAARTALAEAEQLLASGGLNFPSLRSEAVELAATIGQLRSSGTGGAPLTPAELRLLPLLATQRTRQEVADQLFVSVHTVKAQVTSIYRKLGASSRTQAVDRGRSLGLLPAPPPRPSGRR